MKKVCLPKQHGAQKKYSIAEVKEKIELEIAGLRTDKEEKNLTKEDLSQMDSGEISVGNTDSFPIRITSQGYKFEIDENFKVNYVEKFSVKAKLRNKWNLGIENSDFQIYQGTPEYKGVEEGLYLYNSVLTTKENYILNNTYTVIIETKNIENNGAGFMIGFGRGQSGVGGYSLGIVRWLQGHYYAMSGAGDSCTIIEEDIAYTRRQVAYIGY